MNNTDQSLNLQTLTKVFCCFCSTAAPSVAWIICGNELYYIHAAEF